MCYTEYSIVCWMWTAQCFTVLKWFSSNLLATLFDDWHEHKSAPLDNANENLSRLLTPLFFKNALSKLYAQSVVFGLTASGTCKRCNIGYKTHVFLKHTQQVIRETLNWPEIINIWNIIYQTICNKSSESIWP